MYPENVQPFSEGYEQVTLRPIIAQVRRPMINDNLVSDIQYWSDGSETNYEDMEVYLTRPSVSGYIRAYGTPEVGFEELFVPPRIAEQFELRDLEPAPFLLPTADHATQLERFFA